MFGRVGEREFWRVSARAERFRRIVIGSRFTDGFTDSGHSAGRNSLLLLQQDLEARVGIGLNDRFRTSTKQQNPLQTQGLFAFTRHYFPQLANPFTDSFTDSRQA